MSPSLFNCCTVDVIQSREMSLPEHFMISNFAAVDTRLFCRARKAVCRWFHKQCCKGFGLRISTLKTKVLAFHGAEDPIDQKLLKMVLLWSRSVIFNICTIMCLTLETMLCKEAVLLFYIMYHFCKGVDIALIMVQLLKMYFKS